MTKEMSGKVFGQKEVCKIVVRTWETNKKNCINIGNFQYL